jgi:uncharacterized repeat protein (TIGR01451 family)
MKVLSKFTGGAAATALFLSLGLAGPLVAHAATAPTLGSAAPFSAWGKAGVTNNSNVGTTHHWGDVGADAMGNITNLDDATQVDGTIIAPTPAGVQTDISNAYGLLTAQGPGAALDLAGSPTVVPGVYNVAATTMNGTLTLNGPGVYVFLGSATTPIAPGAQMLLTNGATACNVFWAVADSMTIGAGAHMEGTVITNTSLISFGDSASLKGRALSHISQVTMINSQITEPTCVIPSSGGNTGTINVVKHVINDNGGTKTIANFPLFVNGVAVNSGVTNDFTAFGGVYTVTETSDANYTRTFSGDCDTNGNMNLSKGENRFCIVTNDDIGAPVVVPPVPPLIDVVKVPNPLALPGGPGQVQYTYTLRNIGTVPVTNVTMVGDTCTPIVRVSGDVNGDNKLDVNETWVHTCTTTLTQSHTNTVVATGWANGLTATDIASASVVVGLPIVPPLIHVTKVPNPLTLLAGGGMVTYTKKVTNPGTVPLSNVRLTDDKCSVVAYVSGDANGDRKLDMTETWTYTCSTNLTKTTTNTVVALGDANGFTARDFAIATVVVATAVPALPKAGFAPTNGIPAWEIAAAGVLAAALLLFVARRKQTA